jgi:uncharacterized membrane protein YgcG
MHRLLTARLLAVALALALGVALLFVVPASAEQGWVVLSFDAHYVIHQDGSVTVTEDIRVDFGAQRKHGIIRAIPVEYRYEPDPSYRRQTPTSVIGVDDGSRAHRYETYHAGADLEIKIGDPDRTVSGEQRYRIVYSVRGALNAFDEHDELYWNVTGNEWDVPIMRASAVVEAPMLRQAACFEGPYGSQAPCSQQFEPGSATARFASTGQLLTGGGLTIVVAMEKGAVEVAPPLLKKKPGLPPIEDMVGLKPLPIAATLLLSSLIFGAIGRTWWQQGRDRWYGDVHYLTGASTEEAKPLLARETVVVEYAPPEMPATRRRLRPAEIGVLIDERADTLDVSATIIDLAVRGYLVILDEGKKDWQLTQTREADGDLLAYEQRLLNALFDGRKSVSLKSLKDKFYTDLAKVKKDLYAQTVSANHFFPTSPEVVRTAFAVGGGAVALLGLGLSFGLGLLGAGIVGLPIVLGGVLVLLLAGSMPRRTALGRELYRRSRGFREFMETAETDRQRFYEEESIFDKYLPYAIVFRCTDKWARAFAGLESRPAEHSWYVSPRPFVAPGFVRDIDRFSSSVSSAIASTPSSSGSSGFSSGGGFSGGGGGGGGGRSW